MNASQLSVTTGSAALTMNRDERIKRFGIECLGPGGGDGIFFRASTWRPGGEYIQKLIIRNVSTEVKKLKYKLPSTRYFSMAYPEPIILSPGLAQEVDVVFRPVEYEPYDDTIYIKMLDGISGNGFHIPVRATIDNLSLQAPEGLDLGYCTTHQITQMTFHLINTGEIDAPYEWDVPEPFSLVPSQGVVPVGKSHEITLSIRPTDASVFVAQAICHVGRGVHAIIPQPIISTKLSAIGKFAYISLSDNVVSFDEVVSGMIPESKEIVLSNSSVVPAEFQLIRLDNDRDEVFDIHPKQGIIPPRSEVNVIINYRALAMGCYTHDRYAYRTPGNCNTVLTLKGTSMPPKITLYKEVVPTKPKPQQTTNTADLSGSLREEGAPIFSLNFRDIELGKVETRLFFLQNDSPRDVPFYVLGDEHGIFKMTPKQGIIPALVKSYPVKVVFVPTKPINYYRRFFVLVGDALPLFYDCLGTGFIRAKGEVKEQRPAPLRHAHIQAYRNRSVQGYGGLNPDELDALYESNRFSDIAQSFFAHIGRVGTRAFSVTQLQRPVTRTGEALRNLVAPAHEFFIQSTDQTAREVTINRLSLDFGYTTFKTSSAPREVVIHNNTNGKVVVQWYVPIVQGMGENKSNSKSLSKTHEIISIDQEEREIAQLQAFAISPLVADINPGQSQTFLITFVPKQSSRNFLSELEAYVYFKNQRTFRLVNDFSLTPPWSLTVSCLGHTFSSGQLLAKASFFGGNVSHGKLVFPCCFLDESIYQTVMIRNTSNLPCTFHIAIGWKNKNQGDGHNEDFAATSSEHQSNGSVFSVKPDVGEIAAESFILVCIRFTPRQLKKYSDLLRLTINGDDGGKLLLEGTGALPYIIVPDLYEGQVLFPEEIYGITKRSMTSVESIPRGLLGQLYMKPTCVGLSSSRTITLKNATRLPLKYRVILPASAADNLLTISPMFGVLKGNDDTRLTLVFSPKKMKEYYFKVTVQVFPIGGKVKRRVIDANQAGPVDAPELLQEFHVAINAKGEMGALIFDPPKTEADVRLVHTSEEKSIWLENISDSDLSYQLFYRESFQPDSVDQKITTLVTDIMPLRAMPSTLDQQNKKKKARHGETQAQTSTTSHSMTLSMSQSGLNGAGIATMSDVNHALGDEFDHSLFCEQYKGIIPARSRLRCVFTYNPVKSGLFDFTVYAQIHTRNHITQDVVMIPNDTAALMKVTGSIALDDFPPLPPQSPSSNYTQSFSQPSPPARSPTSHRLSVEEVEQSQAILSLLPLTAEFTARAAFPKLLFEDLRLENADLPVSNIDYLWERFSLATLNYDLSIPLTSEEIAINNSSSPDLSKLKVYNFDFTPQVVNSPIQVMNVRLRNHGYLKTSFHFHLPNEKQLELENWCDEEDPSEELNRLICIIEELKLFHIEPKHADLMPGETVDLTISYRHTSLKYHGLHNIPVLVKISQGKQFYLNVRGQTLAAMARKSSVKFIDAKGSLATPASPVSRAGTQVGTAGGAAASEERKSSTAANLLMNSNPADILLLLPNCATNSYRQNILRLAPVPLGLSPIMINAMPVRQGTRKDFAPLQRVELVNVSAYSVLYEVILGSHVTKATDMTPAGGAVGSTSTVSIMPNLIADENYDMNIFQCSNSNGLIPSNSSIFLDVYFIPLEAKKYSFPFTVKYCVAPSTAGSLTMNTASLDGGMGNGPGLGGSLTTTEGSALVLKPALSRGGVKSGTANGTRSGKGSNKTSRGGVGFSGLGVVDTQANVPLVYEYLNATIEAEGFDPRTPKPIPFEHEYIGGRPPKVPVLEFPDRPVALQSDLIDFHIIPQEAVITRVFILNNFSATQSYEFAIDETSCSLCIDGLLTISPLFGKIEPRGKVLLQLTFKAYCQPLILNGETSLKVMVREILKAANKSRGGTRQQLIDRIKSRKVNGIEQHESVVSHITFARSVQILSTEKGQVLSKLDLLAQQQEEAEQLGLTGALAASNSKSQHSLTGEGGVGGGADDNNNAHTGNQHNPFEKQWKTAKFTNTIGKDGKTKEGDLTKAVKSLRPYSTDPDGLMMPGDYYTHEGNQDILQVGDRASSPSSRQSNRSAGSASRGGGAITPMSTNERGGVSRSGGAKFSSGLVSEGGGASRGGVLSSGHSLSSQGNNQAIRYGISFSLIIRLAGEVYGRETIERIHSLHGENKANHYDVINPHFLIPTYKQRHNFIPLLPRKFYDSDFINEMTQIKSKAKVNISFLEPRFKEFRYLNQSISQLLVSNLLNSFEIEQCLRNVVDEIRAPPPGIATSIEAGKGKNSDFIALTATPPLNPFIESQAPERPLPYGIYYPEVEVTRETLTLAQRIILELKHSGYYSISTTLSGLIVFNQPNSDDTSMKKPWQKMDEYTMLQDENDYTIGSMDFLDNLKGWLDTHVRENRRQMREFDDVISALDNR